MQKPNPEPAPEHPIATAVGKALGTIAAKTGLASAPPELASPPKKKRLPRKVKKEAKKRAAKAQSAHQSA